MASAIGFSAGESPSSIIVVRPGTQPGRHGSARMMARWSRAALCNRQFTFDHIVLVIVTDLERRRQHGCPPRPQARPLCLRLDSHLLRCHHFQCRRLKFGLREAVHRSFQSSSDPTHPRPVDGSMPSSTLSLSSSDTFSLRCSVLIGNSSRSRSIFVCRAFDTLGISFFGRHLSVIFVSGSLNGVVRLFDRCRFLFIRNGCKGGILPRSLVFGQSVFDLNSFFFRLWCQRLQQLRWRSHHRRQRLWFWFFHRFRCLFYLRFRFGSRFSSSLGWLFFDDFRFRRRFRIGGGVRLFFHRLRFGQIAFDSLASASASASASNAVFPCIYRFGLFRLLNFD